MLSVDEAIAAVTNGIDAVAAEWCPIELAFGRTLAEPLRAQRDQPPVTVSAMDGYAVRTADAGVGARLRVIGEATAGGARPPALSQGEALRIFTGAAVPEGADGILIQENAARDGDIVQPTASVIAGRFIRPAGLDFAAGDMLLPAGTRLTARTLGLAAALGFGHLRVRRRPRVGLAATGNELRRPGSATIDVQIYSSNTVFLAAAVASFGGDPVDLGILEDRDDAFDRLKSDAAGLDLLVTTGGASVGDHDLVQAALAQRGLELGFWRVAMRPGKPLLSGRLGTVPLLGLPGNPVSTAVCSLVFLRPIVDRLLGRPITGIATRPVPLATPLEANDQRQDYLRANWGRDAAGNLQIVPARRQDSSMLATLARAEALIVRAPFDPERPGGESVEVIDLGMIGGF